MNKKIFNNFSKNLYQLRNIALIITKNPKVKVKFNPHAQTSFYNPITDEITLTLTPYPEWAVKNSRIAQKILDGDCAHECGHYKLSKPLWGYYNSWINQLKRKREAFKLAKELVNLVEDVRINHFIELRYRFDFGKRLKLANDILKDQFETWQRKATPEEIRSRHVLARIMGILTMNGLYGADCSKILATLSAEEKKDVKELLQLMSQVKYSRVRLKIMKTLRKMYEILIKYWRKCENSGRAPEIVMLQLVPARRKGQFKGENSDEFVQQILQQIEAEMREEEKEKLKDILEDLIKGAGAGEGTGEEIPAPEPDFNHYSELLDRNKEEITRLLDKIKKTLKPQIKRENFQRRGRIMPHLVSKAYVNSLRHTVRNIYVNVKSELEKQKVAIGFLIDFSGSVSRMQAEDITTVLNEVFGHFVDDYGFAIGVFGANHQKIKTFFEQFENTRARVGNITVDASGTELAPLLASFIKMLNAIRGERRKMLVIASDFEIWDREKTEELLEVAEKSGIEIIFIGFTNCRKVFSFAPNLKNVRRTTIRGVKELPERFLEVYLNIQK